MLPGQCFTLFFLLLIFFFPSSICEDICFFTVLKTLGFHLMYLAQSTSKWVNETFSVTTFFED